MSVNVKKSARRIGILGGSFDPVHIAHIALARAAAERAHLDEIYFVPAKQAPLRDAAVCAPDSDRIAMLNLALKDFPYPHCVELCEMMRDGISYSIDTAKMLSARLKDCQLFWIIGSDHIAKLKKWRDISELCKIISFICAARPDYKIGEIPEGAKIEFIDFTPMQTSSTAIRNAIAEGKNADLMLDAAVAQYILNHKLYKK